MKNFLGVFLLLSSSTMLVSSLECWMCRAGEMSFKLCDDNKEKQACPQDQTRCGTFSYENATGIRIYAKSCTKEELCTKNSTFCANIRGGGGKDCRVQCCNTELCNFQVGFATTSAPPTTAPTTTAPSTTSPSPSTTNPTTKPETTTRRTTTEKPTTKPSKTTKEPTEMPLNPSKEPQSGDDEEDCSWAVGAATGIINNLFTCGICLILLAINFVGL